MKGRRQRDDGWDEGGQDKQDGRQDPPPDWPAAGDWPGVTAYQRAAQGQQGFGGIGAYGGAGQGYGDAAYGAPFGDGPAPAYGGTGAGYSGPGYQAPGYAQPGYAGAGDPGAGQHGQHAPGYGATGGYRAPDNFGASGGGYAGSDGTGSADGYGNSSGWGTQGGYGTSDGPGASGGYGASWFGDQGGTANGPASAGFGTGGYGGPDQSRGGYPDAGYGQSGYGMQEAPATAQYGRLPAAQLPPGQGPDLASGEYTRSDWGAAANDISPATPRPYGRLSIFTLLEDKVAEFDRLAEHAAEGVRMTEPDTLVYVIHVVPKAPMQRIIYEIYRDRAAFESHERQPHTQRFGEERKACVLATNIIDLRLKYAKVAALAAPQASRSPAETEQPRAPRALETSARMPSFSPHGGGKQSGQAAGEFADPGSGWPAEAGGRPAGGQDQSGGSGGRPSRSRSLDRDQSSYQAGRYGGS